MYNKDIATCNKKGLCVLFILLAVNPGLGSLENSSSSDSSDDVPVTKPGSVSTNLPVTTDSTLKGVSSPSTILDMLPDSVTRLPLFPVLHDRTSDSMTSTCSLHMARLIQATLSGELWALQFLDASGKPGPSVSKGWLNFIGNLDQCQDARAPATSQAPGFKGGYYAVTLSTSISLLTSRVDLCLPHTCSKPAVKSMAAYLLNTSLGTLGLNVSSVQHITNETEVTAATVCFIVVVSILGCLVILGTVFDLVLIQYRPSCTNSCTGQDGQSAPREDRPLESLSPANNYNTIAETVKKSPNESGCDAMLEDRSVVKAFVRFCLVFSAYQNGKTILTIGKSRNSLSSIHGLRFLSCCWIILFQTFAMLQELDVLKNKYSVLNAIRDRWAFIGIAFNAVYAVDTFFAVSGLLVTYHTLVEINKKGWKIDWFRFYVHRYWRLTPPYMLVLLTSLGLTQYLGTGPLWWNEQPFDKETCEDKWWKNLLYISNVDGLHKECMDHGWYLSCNMQFFALSPLLFVPFYFHYAAGLASCFVFLLSSWIITGVLSSANDLSITGFIVFDSLDYSEDYTDDFYVKPWCRIGPFVVGVLAGFVLTKTSGKSLNLPWWVVALGWLASTGTALLVVYGLYRDISGDYRSSTGVAALYNAVARSAWGLSICWIILACDAGYGGPVNAILSWSPFVVLGRLSYMTYLIQSYVIEIVYENVRSPIFYTDYTFAILYTGFLAFCTFASFFFMLLFESPMTKFEEFYFPKDGKKLQRCLFV